MEIIAEIKTHSPFDGELPYSWDELFEIANEVGDIVSIHTDPRWHGSMDLVKRARRLTNKPILAKGIHANDSDIEAAVDAGADFVLAVGRIPEVHQDKCLIEPYTLGELAVLPPEYRAVWNSRDLRTGGLKTETFDQAREIFDGWLCQASNIRTQSDVRPFANAILIGTHLVEFANERGRSLRPQK
jgi:indole-3-glycerol phosphate synthase